MRKVDYHYQQYGKTKILSKYLKLDDRYSIRRRLGHGGFANVFEAYDEKNKRLVAIKVLDLHELKSKNDGRSKKLIELSTNQPFNLQRVDSDYVVKCYDVFQNKEGNLKFLIMQYLEGPTLQKHVWQLSQEDRNTLQELEAFEIFAQIAKGIKELHQNKIMHRDLHPGNIIRDGRRWVVVDLGFSKMVRQRSLVEVQTNLGALMIKAPQMINFKSPYGMKVDVWSLGINLFYMLTSRYLIDSNIAKSSSSKILEHIQRRLAIQFEETMENEKDSQKSILKSFNTSPEMTRLLKDLLQFNAKDRMTINQVFNHQSFIYFNKKLKQQLPLEETNQQELDIPFFDSPKQVTFEEQCELLLKHADSI